MDFGGFFCHLTKYYADRMRKDKMKAAKVKVGNYCAYQERTHQEVRDKLYSLGLFRDEVEEVLTELISEDFVSEERFARTYASGKFRLKHWGKRKIIYALKQKKISTYCIDQALKEIPDDEYEHAVISLIEKKQSMLPEKDDFVVKSKIAKYLVGKGFESELVWTLIDRHLKPGG